MLGAVTTWRLLLLPLAVLLPLLVYVAGTLSTGPEGPSRPRPVILQDDGAAVSPAGRDAREGGVRPDGARHGDGRRSEEARRPVGDNARDRDDEDDDDDGDPEVVLPSPTQLGDDDDDPGDDGDDGDDD